MILFVPSIKRGHSGRKIDVVQGEKERMQNCSMSRTFRFLRAKQVLKMDAGNDVFHHPVV